MPPSHPLHQENAPDLYILYIFSQEFKIKTWRRLWIALAKAEKKLGLEISEDQIKELEKLLKSHPKADNFILVSSEPKLYEILPKGVSKGKLLCKMAKLLGIDMGKTIAVGDYYNDVSMIKNAGIGFAVANAVDDAKTVADYITVNNNEHAIAKIIEGLDRGIYKF